MRLFNGRHNIKPELTLNTLETLNNLQTILGIDGWTKIM